MSENKVKKQDHTDMDHAAQQIVDMAKDNFSQQVNTLKDQLEKGVGSLRTTIEERTRSLDEKISLGQEKTNKRLDDLDEALRGNGRIGLFEQTRSLTKQIKMLWVLIVFLLGLKVYGFTIEEWVSTWWKSSPKTQQVVDVKLEPNRIVLNPATKPSDKPQDSTIKPTVNNVSSPIN
jgi:hypothetical protein